MSKLKKSLLSLFLALFLVINTNTQIHAQTEPVWYYPTLEEFLTKVEGEPVDEIFGERYTFAQVVWIWYSLIAIVLPKEYVKCFAETERPDITTIAECIGEASESLGILSYSEKPSLASSLEQIISYSPASGIGYIKNTLSKLRVIPEAKAQAGFGFGTLTPIQRIWGMLRNSSYFLMIIAFVILSFMIMFRVKTSPQTIITIQSAIPKLILILIFVTFSYAIAGFVIDLSYLSLGVLSLAATPATNLDASLIFQKLLDPLSVYVSMAVTLIIYSLTILFASILGITTQIGAGFLGFGVIITLLKAVLFLILFFAFAIVWVRLLWVLFKTFLNVVLLIIFSPILILTGILPIGSGFNGWLRNLAAQTAVFPVSIALIFLAHFLFWSSISSSSGFNSDELFLLISDRYPDLFNPFRIESSVGNTTIQLPGFNLPPGGLFGFLVAFGTIMLVPSATNIIQSAISGRPFAYGTALGVPLMTAAGIATWPLANVWGAVSAAHSESMKQIVLAATTPVYNRLRKFLGIK